MVGVDADEEKEEAETDELVGCNKTERERLIRLARQEIQGAWDYFGTLEVVTPLMQKRELDKGSTGLGEVFENSELECTFCCKVNDHRCGECILPSHLEELAEEITGVRGVH